MAHQCFNQPILLHISVRVKMLKLGSSSMLRTHEVSQEALNFWRRAGARSGVGRLPVHHRVLLPGRRLAQDPLLRCQLVRGLQLQVRQIKT